MPEYPIFFLKRQGKRAELTLAEKLRTAHTKRWQIVNVGRNQNVAEHSFLVQLIAIEVSRACEFSNARQGPFNTEKEHQIMRWAMWHDMMEVKTGDINTPVKAVIKKAVGESGIETLEKSYSAEYTKISADTWPITKDIVKLADYMEALNFLNEEGKGVHAKDVQATLRAQMMAHYHRTASAFPSLKWEKVKKLLIPLCEN